MQELLFYLQERGYKTPVIANVFVVSAPAARYMHKGKIPGCYMHPELLALLEEEATAADKGMEARYLRAAKMVAIARGLGYSGVHIGGSGLTKAVVAQILDTAAEIQDDWRLWAKELQYGAPNAHYLYEPELGETGEPTGLNAPSPSPRDEVARGGKIFRTYGLSRFFHHWVLTKDRRGYKLLKPLMDWRERRRGRHRNHGLEHLGKTMLYGCMDCGDCGLEAAIYSCPMTACPKSQRNGPCGGSADGWCEVYPLQKYCIHFKAYHRLKKHGELHKLAAFITPPNNWDYFETSGWSNYTHERDNAAKRQYLATSSSGGLVEK
jgi:methylenetetrahydrofolate reductase (NADPH)